MKKSNQKFKNNFTVGVTAAILLISPLTPLIADVTPAFAVNNGSEIISSATNPYGLLNIRWPNAHKIPYYIDNSLPSNIKATYQKAINAYNETGIVKLYPVSANFKDYQGVEQAYIYLTQKKLDSVVNNGQTMILNGTSQTLSSPSTNLIFKSTVYLADFWQGANVNQTTLYVAEHEMGHALGLGHTSDKNSVMTYDTPTTGLTLRDKQALQLRYDLPAGQVNTQGTNGGKATESSTPITSSKQVYKEKVTSPKKDSNKNTPQSPIHQTETIKTPSNKSSEGAPVNNLDNPLNLSEMRWAQSNLTAYLNPKNSVQINKAYQHAIQEINQKTNVKIHLISNANANLILSSDNLKQYIGDSMKQTNNNNLGNTIEHATVRVSTTINNHHQAYLNEVALHEMGHALGLKHSSNDTVMSSSRNHHPNLTNRDIQAINARFQIPVNYTAYINGHKIPVYTAIKTTDNKTVTVYSNTKKANPVKINGKGYFAPIALVTTQHGSFYKLNDGRWLEKTSHIQEDKNHSGFSLNQLKQYQGHDFE